jgi:hypothetical protein
MRRRLRGGQIRPRVERLGADAQRERCHVQLRGRRKSALPGCSYARRRRLLLLHGAPQPSRLLVV